MSVVKKKIAQTFCRRRFLYKTCAEYRFVEPRNYKMIEKYLLKLTKIHILYHDISPTVYLVAHVM